MTPHAMALANALQRLDSVPTKKKGTAPRQLQAAHHITIRSPCKSTQYQSSPARIAAPLVARSTVAINHCKSTTLGAILSKLETLANRAAHITRRGFTLPLTSIMKTECHHFNPAELFRHLYKKARWTGELKGANC